jgi:Fe-S oxidoreductase
MIMALPTASVLGVLADNLKKRESVLPLSRRRMTGWAAQLGIPAGGETVLYTGQMYQIIPTLMKMELAVAVLDDHWMAKFFSVGRAANKALNLSRLISRVDPGEQEAYDNCLRNIVRLLRMSNVDDFGYLYGEELYAGALIHDLGLDQLFERHALKVYRMLESHGVRRVITVDPHTTDMLKNVYPQIVPGYRLEVRSYLEILADRRQDPVRGLDLDIVIHDSCVYARSLNLIDEPRQLLENAGATVQESENSGKLAFCCGGPAESLFPSKAREIAAKRMEQLSAVGRNVVTMCPVCLLNLRNAAKPGSVTVTDIADHLTRAHAA